MCIRDRSVTVNYDAGNVWPRSFSVNWSALGSIQDSAQIVDCLLYTSDAADERSSVDLGGRRIIKKKTIADIQR